MLSLSYQDIGLGLTLPACLLFLGGGLNLDNLPEEVVVDVEGDYQVCMRMLARTGTGTSRKKTKA